MSPTEVSVVPCTVASLALAVSFVLSLYVWNTNLERDHPKTIRRRFVSVFCMLLLSPPFVYLFGSPTLLSAQSLHVLVGLRWSGLATAVLLPLLLTSVLFLGPIATMVVGGARYRLWLMPEYWRLCLRDLIWWRNHVVAPFAEEYIFRACMLPILLRCYSPQGAVVVSPLFFGTAHLHVSNGAIFGNSGGGSVGDSSSSSSNFSHCSTWWNASARDRTLGRPCWSRFSR
jgi:prenyl protein peptidase